MTYYPVEGNNSVGQSSVLIKRRSRVQVPVALPILCGVAQWESVRLLIGWVLVRVQPPQPYLRKENV